MNDFERRFLDMMQASAFVQSIKRTDGNIVATDFFAYNVAIEGVTAVSVGQGNMQIQADSDFVAVYMSAQTIAAGAAVTTPLQTVQVTDTGTGKTFFTSETLQSLVFGNGGFPFLLPAPRVIVPNTNILINVTNVSAAATYDTYFSMMGMRVYYS